MRSRKGRAVFGALALLALLAGEAGAHPREVRFPVGAGPDEELRLEPLRRHLPVLAVHQRPGGELWILGGAGGLSVRGARGRWHPPTEASAATRLLAWGPDLVLLGPFSPPRRLRAGGWHPLWPTPPGPLGQARDAAVHGEELLVAASGGLVALDPLSIRPRLLALPAALAGSPAALASDGERLVVATDAGGLAIRDADTWRLLRAGERATTHVAPVAAAAGGRVVVGGPGWLEQWDPDGRRRDLLAETPALGRPAVTDLALDGDALWVATRGAGVLLRRRGAWRQLSPPWVGLGSDVVHAIELADDGAALVATARGLARVRFVPRKEEADATGD